MASGYLLDHSFWTNWNSDLLSTSKWPSEPQFCERKAYIWQKSGQKRSYSSHLRVTFVSDRSLIPLIGRLYFDTLTLFFRFDLFLEAKVEILEKNSFGPNNDTNITLCLWSPNPFKLQSKNESPVIYDGIIFVLFISRSCFFLPKISSSNAQ